MSGGSLDLPKKIIVVDENGEETLTGLSDECDAQASYLLTDPNYITLRQQSSQFCRLKTQNALAGCCTDFSYELGMFYNCNDDCVADCTLEGIGELCHWYGGRTCTATFNPTSGNPSKYVPVSIVESICIPSECDNDSDRSILFQLPVGNSPQNLLNPKIYYYPTHLNVNEGIECESGMGTIIGIMAACLLSAVLLIAAFVYLFIVPKSKHKNKAYDKAMDAVFGDELKQTDGSGSKSIDMKQGSDTVVDVNYKSSNQSVSDDQTRS